jgi:hypothetical protein
MRLIDADKLMECYESTPECNIYDCSVSIPVIRQNILDMSTVNPYEWISVEDRLPEKFTNVLCLYPSKNYESNIVVDYMESDRGYFAEQFRYGEPTHWMPLPQPPTEKEN